MKVFLTDATGYVGSEITKLLKAEGHTVGEQCCFLVCRDGPTVVHVANLCCRTHACSTSHSCAVSLARSKEKVEKLKAAGVQAVLGSLEQPELLAKAAAEGMRYSLITY